MVPGPSAGKQILMVEDDDAIRYTLRLVLEGAGYTVSTAANGVEALERLQARPLPDLILLDLMLPQLSGWEFRERQRRDPALASIPVVVLSVLGADAERADALGGVVGYLQKPVDADELLAVVQRFAGSHRPEVLVVDDEPVLRTLLDAALRHFGFAVRLADGGREAVEIYRRHHATITLVLLDVRMPDLDGPGTLALLRQLNPHVRSCFMTGQAGQYTEEELLALGAARVFRKPFSGMAELTHALWNIATGLDPGPP
jgi:CheY-like chemotaxis protein